MEKWNGKKKAITFSFDDGILQDIRAIEILNKYGLKATFNISTGFLGTTNDLFRNNRFVYHNKVRADQLKTSYAGHEVAVHGFTHPDLRQLSDEEVIEQVEKDRKILEILTGQEVVGMAYPFGFYDERIADILAKHTPIKYARTVNSTYNFDLQTELLTFHPSIQETEEQLFDLAKKFIDLKTDKPQLFYVWGHTFEMDAELISWEKFEEFCKFVSGKEDIFYGTNKEVLL